MKFKKAVTVLSASAIIFAGGIGLTSCSNDITAEQLAEISSLRKEKRSLSQKVETKQGELSEIEREINAQQSKLDDCNERQRFVKEKLAQWPNMWPDWKPEAEKQESTEKSK